MKVFEFFRSWKGVVATVGLIICSVVLVSSAVATETYFPECFTPESSDTKVIQFEARKGPYKLAFVNGFVGNDWRMQAIQSCKAWAARPENKKDIKELKIVSVGNDIAAQIAAIDNYISAGFDGIIFIAVNPTAFNSVIKRAERAGTVLVAFDNILDTDQIVQVCENSHELGRLNAEAMVRHMGTKGTVLEVHGVPGSTVDRDRSRGAHEYLKQFPDISIVEVVGMWDDGTTQKVVADAIAIHGRFDGMWVQHGTTGAINAIIDSGHPIVPMGCGGNNSTVMLMAKYKIPGNSVGNSPTLSAAAMMATVALLKGKALPQLIQMPIPYVNSEDIKEGVHYWPNLPASFYTAISFEQCDLIFTAEELLSFTADNQ